VTIMSITNCDVIVSDVSSTRRTKLLSPETASSYELRCSSAPQSRAGSFKKTRRQQHNETPRASLPSLEESILAKLEQLKQLEEDNCCAVRQFDSSPRGIVNRGDSFRHRRTSPPVSNDEGLFVNDERQGPIRQTSLERTRVVMVIGDHGVGKTSLLQQFMTSQYMAAMNTSFGEWLLGCLNIELWSWRVIEPVVSFCLTSAYSRVVSLVLVYC